MIDKSETKFYFENNLQTALNNGNRSPPLMDKWLTKGVSALGLVLYTAQFSNNSLTPPLAINHLFAYLIIKAQFTSESVPGQPELYSAIN